MNDHELFQKTFSHLHAPEHTLKEVMNMAEQKKPKKITAKRLVVLGAVITAVLALTVAASATGALKKLADLIASLSPAENPGQVLVDAYGDQISNEPVQLYDAHGNPIEMPVMERLELNSAQAEKLIGAYISDVDGTFTLGEDTFTLKNFLIDEDGNGLLTWTLENPNGATFANSGYGGVYFPSAAKFHEPQLEHHTEETTDPGVYLFNHLLSESEDGTQAEFVTYFGTYHTYQPGDRFVWKITDGSREKSIEIIPGIHIGVRTLTDETGAQVGISSHAISVALPGQMISPKTVVIHYLDGSEYCVADERVLNNVGSFMRHSEDNSEVTGYLFNRLVDTAQVSHVEVTAIRYEAKTTETFVFYP